MKKMKKRTSRSAEVVRWIDRDARHYSMATTICVIGGPATLHRMTVAPLVECSCSTRDLGIQHNGGAKKTYKKNLVRRGILQSQQLRSHKSSHE
jgi:hypothetical protein